MVAHIKCLSVPAESECDISEGDCSPWHLSFTGYSISSPGGNTALFGAAPD